MTKRWWLVFASFQVVGLMLWLLVNVHENIPLFLFGMFLALPGSAVIEFYSFADGFPSWAVYLLVVAINFSVWAAATILMTWIQNHIEPQ